MEIREVFTFSVLNSPTVKVIRDRTLLLPLRVQDDYLRTVFADGSAPIQRSKHLSRRSRYLLTCHTPGVAAYQAPHGPLYSATSTAM